LSSHKIFRFVIASIALLLLYLLIFPIYGNEKKQTDSSLAVKGPVELVNISKAKATAGHKIIVYYFHMTARCETCMKIEKLTLEAVNEAFKKELGAGTIETKVINIDEDANSHFTKDYKLRAQAVIISDMAGSNEKRWKTLEKIWDYDSDEIEFKEYIIDEVKAYF
jgi:hypothetical protein